MKTNISAKARRERAKAIQEIRRFMETPIGTEFRSSLYIWSKDEFDHWYDLNYGHYCAANQLEGGDFDAIYWANWNMVKAILGQYHGVNPDKLGIHLGKKWNGITYDGEAVYAQMGWGKWKPFFDEGEVK